MDYVRSFIIGSSAPIFIPFHVAVQNIPEKNFSAENYPVVASLYFGIMNAISKALGQIFSLTLFQRLFTINIVSIIFVILWITANQSYSFDSICRWLLQYGLIGTGHSTAYLGIMYPLEKFLC